MTEVKEAENELCGMKRKPEDEAALKEDPLGLVGVCEFMSTVTCHLWYNGDAAEAVELYKKAFLAKVTGDIVKSEDGRVLHAFLTIGNTNVMLADSFPGHEQGPKENTSCSFWVYTKDCDALYERAMEHGMEGKDKPADMFWGDRMAKLKDPFGHMWMVATPLKNKPSSEEIKDGQKEWEQNFKKQKNTDA